MIVHAELDQAPAAATLAAAVANIRAYHQQHPCGDYHLEILLASLLAALQVYANASTDETIRAVICGVVDGDDGGGRLDS